MAFVDDLTENLQKVSRDLSGKAQEGTETVKIRGRISDAEDLLKSTYVQLGKSVYEKYGTDENSEFADEFRIIAEAKSAIDQYRRKLNDARGVRVCANCGAEISRQASFCPKCGAAQTEEAAGTSEEGTAVRHCPKCGAELEAGARFCVKCGSPVEQEEN